MTWKLMRSDCQAMRAGVLTDIHVVEDAGRALSWHNRYDLAGIEERLARAAELFAAERVDLVVVLGDVAHDGDAPSMRRALEPLRGSAPLLVVGGNHEGPQPTAALTALGLPELRLPGWRAIAAPGGAVRVAGAPGARRAPQSWRLARPPALLTWGEGPVLLATHFPVISRAQRVRAAGLPYPGDLADRAALGAALAQRPAPTIVVCGHLHVRDSLAEGSLLQIACCALVEPPFEATVLDIDASADASVSVVRRAHELGGATKLRRDPRLAPAAESWEFSARRAWRQSRPVSRAPRAPRRAP